MDPSKVFTKAAKKLFTDMDFKGEPFSPYQFVQVVRQLFPQFNETDDHGHHKQQDADEGYVQFLSTFKNVLKGDEDEKQSFIDQLFGIELENTLTNTETDQEPA